MLYSLKLESGKLSALLHQHNYPAACKLLVNCQSKLAGLSHENFATLEYKKLFADLSQYFEQLPSWLCENVPGGSSIWIKAQEQFIDEQKKQAACAVLASYSQKSRMAYVLLGLFLGYFGIHNFYAGYTGRGVAQLLLCLFSPMLLFIPLLVLFVWTLIEICIVTQDAQGLRFQ
ncbi:TM2 domain-containing protein [bacterium]|nr:TM2 domain-containing protein [bacterium]